MESWADMLYRVHAAGNDFDVLTPDEAARIWHSADDLSLLVDGLARQHTKGERCSVCLMTPQQSKAANYDCFREC